MNKPSRISPNKVLQSWLIYTVYHLLVKSNKIEGGGLKREGGRIRDCQRKITFDRIAIEEVVYIQ